VEVRSYAMAENDKEIEQLEEDLKIVEAMSEADVQFAFTYPREILVDYTFGKLPGEKEDELKQLFKSNLILKRRTEGIVNIIKNNNLKDSSEANEFLNNNNSEMFKLHFGK
jgi:hypothetical protein